MKNFKLDEHPKIGSGLRAPEGYFDNLSVSVMEQINTDVKVIPLYRRPKMIWIAAAVLVGSLMVPLVQHRNNDQSQPDAVSIENYLTYQTNISDADIAALLDAEDLDKMDSEISIDDKSIEEVLTSDSNFENLID
ncbi:hypothetical protein HYN48_10105 [Flavobacterium magnum]|uniref:Uncharacterized protein n=1 Tax=Flavobacterium magnum TaxID=2162713 RepID=A0A2S0RFH7_9FLAO|nr:hypothetical protein [Flavobacterium magnum]AWA30414.1 hypothetical protein HYN48_10105 [Flavobacterium magnum]